MAAIIIKVNGMGSFSKVFIDKMSQDPKGKEREIAIRIITSPIRFDRIVIVPAFIDREF